MQHPLKFVADNQRLDLVLFVDYAVGHADKYSLELHVPDLQWSTVSTWYVDDLVKDFRATIQKCDEILTIPLDSQSAIS